jgi:hypothetical protein
MADVETAFIGEDEATLCQGTVTGTLQREYLLRMVGLLMTGLLPMKTIFAVTIVPVLQEQASLQNPGRRHYNKDRCAINTLLDPSLEQECVFFLAS